MVIDITERQMELVKGLIESRVRELKSEGPEVWAIRVIENYEDVLETMKDVLGQS